MGKNKKTNKIIEYSKLENKVAALWTRVSSQDQEKKGCDWIFKKKYAKSMQ